jgi:seryl-tRNA synthetase
MHDIKTIRDDPAAFKAAMARRNLEIDVEALLALDAGTRDRKTELQQLQARRNEVARSIGQFMKSDPAKAEALKKEAGEIKAKIAAFEAEGEGETVNEGLTDALLRIPNRLAADVPEGRDESANKELRRVGGKPSLGFAPKDHVALGEGLGMMNFEEAAKLSGARFVVLKKDLARLERAIANFMLDLHTGEFGYAETNPPLLVRAPALQGTGQLPKFEEDLFRTANDFWLIPTSEVSLTNLVREEVLDPAQLPMRMTAWTPCFRSEAGAAGKDTRGMIRQHQFSKVELVSITTPEQSEAEHERMTSCAEEVLKRLGLHYRVMLLCAGDTGFSARKTYDIEVWLPGQDNFREISSCSNCGDFQARRMKARYRKGEKDIAYVHTLNGSGLAVGRTLIAVMENYQQADGSIAIPGALQPYMGGKKVITK